MSYRMTAPTFATVARVLRFVARHPVVFATGLLLAVALSVGLHLLERREEKAGERRVAVRATMASSFVASYVADLQVDQRSAARVYLSDSRTPDADFARIVDANRFHTAILLDSSGRVREAHPVAPGLIGTRLTSRYEHLRRALDGRAAVSNVVPSAAERLPVVAIATPVLTDRGMAVFSTAYELSYSPLTAYLASAMPLSADTGYLIDAYGRIVASKRREGGVTLLADRDPALSAAIAGREDAGVLAGGGADRFYVVRRVKGTPWRFVATRPLAEVHTSWHGEHQWASAAVAGGSAAAILLICALLARLLETRTRLLLDVARRQEVERELVRERALLTHQATHDPLTGLPNRALLFARMERVYAESAADPRRRAGILFIDLDGFKPINDAHGHEVGDRVLAVVAERLRQSVRPTDTVSRLGGDEFAVLCDPLGSESVCAIGERIRTAIEQPIAVGDGRTVCVGASVGLAEHPATGDPQRLLADADADMYATKVARRRTNRGVARTAA
jgi:diguanylate cyclase (GGDEF)-like protein